MARVFAVSSQVKAAMVRAQGGGLAFSSSASTSVAAKKKAVRLEVKAKLAELTGEQAKAESTSVASFLLGWSAFKAASSVGLYVSCPKLKEVQTDELLEACLRERKACYVPRVDGDGLMRMLRIESAADLAPAPPYGIPEPKERDERGAMRAEAVDEGLDLLVIPGLAFDAEGRRLGRGAGYYDRYLVKLLERSSAESRRRPVLAAVCFECQVVPEVPCEKHDMRVDAVISSRGGLLSSEQNQVST